MFRLMVFFLITMVSSIWSEKNVATVIDIQGVAKATQPNEAARTLSKGAAILEKDTISVLENAALQAEYLDKSYLLLKPNTTFVVDQYHFKENDPNNHNYSQLVTGGFRMLSGAMETNPDNYNVKTLNATIGMLGTLVDAQMDPDNALSVGCTKGHVQITNGSGSIIIGEGMEQYAVVTSYNRRPNVFINPPAPRIQPNVNPHHPSIRTR